MKARVSSLPPRAVLAISVGAVLVYALVVWFLLVAPKRSEAATLADDIAATELQLAQTHATAGRPRVPQTHVADVLRLAKAMPSSSDQAGLLLELDRLARATGVTLGSVAPQEPALGAGGATTITVVVTAEGSYRQISRFLGRTRGLVQVGGGRVRATGRLLTLQALELAESHTRRFPFLDATMTFDAFVYDAPIVPVAPPSTATEDQSSSGASAAGSTP